VRVGCAVTFSVISTHVFTCSLERKVSLPKAKLQDASEYFTKQNNASLKNFTRHELPSLYTVRTNVKHKVANCLRHYSTSWKVVGSRSDEVNFSIYLILPAALGPGVHSAPNRNEYQNQKIMFLGSRARPAHRAGKLTVIYEPIV
jgi:hypothetical protein